MSLKIYSRKTVLDTSLERVRWLFDEFPNVVVGYSGGKDSTICFNLALQVAREKGRLPLKVMFLDQEAEWQATVDQVTSVMEHPDVEPRWFQMPIRLFNATSATEHWLNCWDPEREDDWMRPRWPGAITENVYGTDRFHEIFEAILAHDYPDTKTCYIAGVRAEESPARLMGLTNSVAYKWATWGRILNRKRGHYTMYPIYDWSYSDVWKAIHDHGWDYNRIYDYYYQYGIPVMQMRVSNVHHETAVKSLFILQELEPATWDRLAARLAGIDMAAKFGAEDYMPSTLPYMFGSWLEYRDYLLEHLILDEDWQTRFRKHFAHHDRIVAEGRLSCGPDIMYKTHIKAILVNDWEGITLDNFLTAFRVGVAEKLDRLRRGVTSSELAKAATR